MRRCRLAVGALGVLALLLAAAGARAQSRPAPAKDAAVILILDASKSMKDDDGTGRPKFQAAKEALDTLVDELPDEAKVGLRAYGSEVSGSGRQAGCADTKLVSPVAALDRAGIKAQIGALEPRGFTPIGASLQGAVNDLGSAKQKTVVLVSDGGDNCKPPDPCAVAREISKGGIDLKIQAVGFRVKAGARRQLQCIARAGGGRYVDATDAEGLGAQLRALTARALRPYITVGERIEPAPTPEAARPHRPGRYTTELAPGTEAWYAFEVGAGQAIDVSATLPASDAGIPTQLRTELQSERLEVRDSDLATNSGDVLTATMNAQAARDDFERPPRGRALVRLEADAAEGQAGPYPIEFAIRVTGEVAEEGTPPKADGGGSDGDGVSAGLAGGLAALVGVGVGGALGGLGRRRAA
jgi:Ca-activated chloride channel family protein